MVQIMFLEISRRFQCSADTVEMFSEAETEILYGF